MPTLGAQRLLDNERHIAWTIFLVLSLAFGSLLLLVQARAVQTHLISSDGVGYFAHLPSILIDHDIDFTDDFEAFGRTPDRNHWPIGTAIAWLPFFLLGHLATRLGVALGYDFPLDGTAYPEQLACCMGSVILACAGIALSYRLACRWLEPRWSLLGSAAILVCSNLPYYLLAEPYMSHCVSVFWVSLLLYLGTEPEPPTLSRAALLGVIGGLAALTRPQDGLFLLLPFLYHAGRLQNVSKGRLFGGLLLAGLVSAILFSGQVYIWTDILAKNPIQTEPQPHSVKTPKPKRNVEKVKRDKQHHAKNESQLIPGGKYRWLNPSLFGQLFGEHYGLFRWHPAYLLSLPGLLLLLRKQKRIASLLLAGFAIQSYVIGMWGGQGQAFGGRMFLCCYPLFVVGTSCLFADTGKRGRWLVLSVHTLLMLWNIWLMLAYRGHFKF